MKPMNLGVKDQTGIVLRFLILSLVSLTGLSCGTQKDQKLGGFTILSSDPVETFRTSSFSVSTPEKIRAYSWVVRNLTTGEREDEKGICRGVINPTLQCEFQTEGLREIQVVVIPRDRSEFIAIQKTITVKNPPNSQSATLPIIEAKVNYQGEVIGCAFSSGTESLCQGVPRQFIQSVPNKLNGREGVLTIDLGKSKLPTPNGSNLKLYYQVPLCQSQYITAPDNKIIDLTPLFSSCNNIRPGTLTVKILGVDSVTNAQSSVRLDVPVSCAETENLSQVQLKSISQNAWITYSSEHPNLFKVTPGGAFQIPSELASKIKIAVDVNGDGIFDTPRSLPETEHTLYITQLGRRTVQFEVLDESCFTLKRYETEILLDSPPYVSPVSHSISSEEYLRARLNELGSAGDSFYKSYANTDPFYSQKHSESPHKARFVCTLDSSGSVRVKGSSSYGTGRELSFEINHPTSSTWIPSVPLDPDAPLKDLTNPIRFHTELSLATILTDKMSDVETARKYSKDSTSQCPVEGQILLTKATPQKCDVCTRNTNVVYEFNISADFSCNPLKRIPSTVNEQIKVDQGQYQCKNFEIIKQQQCSRFDECKCETTKCAAIAAGRCSGASLEEICRCNPCDSRCATADDCACKSNRCSLDRCKSDPRYVCQCDPCSDACLAQQPWRRCECRREDCAQPTVTPSPAPTPIPTPIPTPPSSTDTPPR